MLTKVEYKKYKALIEEYEAANLTWDEKDFEDDDYYGVDDNEVDPLEEEFNACHCGAYILGSGGRIIKVSDCIC